MDDDVMPPEVLLRVLASIDFDRWSQGETRRRILGHLGAHPQGVAVSNQDLADITYRTRGVINSALRSLVEDGVLIRAGGVGTAAVWYVINPVIEEWSVPWAVEGDNAAELVRGRCFHVEHRTRDNGRYVRLVARPMARATSASSRAGYGPRDNASSRAGYGPRDNGTPRSPSRAPYGPRDKNPLVARPMTRATTEPDPLVVVVPTSESGDEPSSSSRPEQQKGAPDPVIDGLIGALCRRVKELNYGAKAFVVPAKRDGQLVPLVDLYGAEHLHKLIRQLPPGLLVPSALDWLQIAAATPDDVDDDQADEPAFGMTASPGQIRIKLASLRSQLETYRALDVDDDDEHLQDLLNDIATCENDLAATGEGATA